MRKCLFCSNNANSLEDAWPHWMTNQFKASQLSEAQLERRGIKHKPWRVHQPELKVRYVCQPCNNGWMSQLESQAKHFLQPLLIGEHCSLDISGKTTVALWSLKTSMVLEALDQPSKRAYTQQEREQLRTQCAIPWRTSVWLASSINPSIFLSCKNRHLNADDEKNISGVSITMAFAHLVLQVLTIRVPPDVGPTTQVTTNVRRGPWDQATVQIWPAKPIQTEWPPQLGLNSEWGIDALADRFSAALLDENELTVLAV
jgi:hypothetical protein